MLSNVAQWLEQLGLGQYAETFTENAIDWKTLPELDHNLLKELGVTAVGHRVAMLKAIAVLEAEAPAEVPSKLPAPELKTTSSEAERRHLTVMFCDLVGSTELSQQLDPEDLRDVNRAYQDVCKQAIERYDGFVARYMGDGVLAYFGYPQAHEDDAEGAIHAGLAIVEAVSHIKNQNLNLAVRVGIATGAVVVGDLIGEGASQESAVVGETPNLASRLQGLATSNSVVIGPGTQQLVSGRFKHEDLGTHSLKGLAEPVQVWRVIAPIAVESRFKARQQASMSPLVGREHEVGLLMERWAQAEEEDGQVVLLSGEAGIGKSRISEALLERTDSNKMITLRYQCSPHHTNSALYPVIQQMVQAANFDSEDKAATRLDKLTAVISRGLADVSAVMPLFAALLSIRVEGLYPLIAMPPEQQKAATLRALLDQMEALSRHQPTLMIFEDVHWADPTTLELLELVVERVQSLPIMVMITFRPEFISPWNNYSHVTALTLNRFTRGLATAMVVRLAGAKILPADLLEQIIERTDGVPLFVEELTKTILESGQMSGSSIPTTLHDSLMARLDRLGAVKEVAQIASVIGREFTFDLLATISPLSFAALHDALEQLMDAELVFRRTRSQEETFTFKHALVQDAAYESLLLKTRRQLHKRIAETLESRFPETVEAQPEILGHHYTEAGIAGKAILAWQAAAQRAVERSANKEAIAYLNKALSQVSDLPDPAERSRYELNLQIAISGPLITIKGYGDEDTGRAFSRAQALSTEVGVTAELFPVMYGRWVYALSWQRYAECKDIASQFSELAGQQTNTGPQLMGHRVTGVSQFVAGLSSQARDNLESVIDVYREDEHSALRFKFGQDPSAAANAFLAPCLWQLGYPEQASKALERAVKHAAQLNHVNTLAYVNIFGGALLHQLAKDDEQLANVSATVNALASEHGLVLWKELIAIVDGWVSACCHNEPSGIDVMHRAINVSREVFSFQLPYKLSMLADGHRACGDPALGLEHIDEAIEIAHEVGERCFEPELHRVKAGLLLAAGQPIVEAEASLLESMQTARALGVRSYELRAATELARLWGESGRRGEASALLSPVYEGFTEGFNTHDLKQAGLLLAELA
jgi:class 3 adenylate cyclase/predicted ATPase